MPGDFHQEQNDRLQDFNCNSVLLEHRMEERLSRFKFVSLKNIQFGGLIAAGGCRDNSQRLPPCRKAVGRQRSDDTALPAPHFPYNPQKSANLHFLQIAPPERATFALRGSVAPLQYVDQASHRPATMNGDMGCVTVTAGGHKRWA